MYRETRRARQFERPLALISVSPTSFNFGNIDVGFSSGPQPLTVSNIGDRNLIIGTISPNPTPSGFGLVNDDCSGQTLPPLASCTLGIVFAPSGPTAPAPVLTIVSNDPDTPALDGVFGFVIGIILRNKMN